MLPYALGQIDAAAFQAICDQRFSESGTLDFKQELTRNDDKGKNELAKDVCALANADGGDLVYGIKENSAGGTAESVAPLVGESYDDASRRLLQTLESWVEPRIRGIQLEHVPLEGGFGLVIRVPASFDGPHCIRNNNSQRRFVLRNGTITSDMTYDQLRSAFGSSASLAAQAREFVKSRLKLVEDRRMRMPMGEAPLAVLELVSLSGLANRSQVDVKRVQFVDFITWDGGANPRMNLDGTGAYLGADGEAYSQSLFFRNGSMEYMTIAGGEGLDGKMGVHATHTLDFFERCLTVSLEAAKKYEISGPALVTCALMHVGSCVLALDGYSAFRQKRADRPFMVFPEIYIEDVSIAVDVAVLLSHTRDVLYQAFGYSAAPAKK
ncbi:Putative DNA-binding domain-containing protein [Variovorax sp. YR750]|uniref:AlbA family DNA-binding domain-containing protein n=1 Tax=Variovorax sp. YR750 TaxID=1884384 RepID=UPI0008CE0E8D|nr:ATP-binding protein [Variovorax sp. YR750]SEM04005.1 Putative DNA-binding domain-containing protein [Variovorax sp. YR750]